MVWVLQLKNCSDRAKWFTNEPRKRKQRIQTINSYSKEIKNTILNGQWKAIEMNTENESNEFKQ